MITLTQEKREELIVEVSRFLNDNTFLRSTVEKQVYEITLASLTAEPVATVYDDELQDLKNGYMGTLITTNFEHDLDIPTHRLYIAPPVTEIKLPEIFGEPVEDNFDSGKELGWNKCLEEVKRLNGLDN